jgi:DNA-binding NtrC family response regulator
MRLYLRALSTDTLTDPLQIGATRTAHDAPGVVIVHSGDRPRCIVFPLVDGKLEIGRDDLARAGIRDGRVSRHHVRVELAREQFSVRDLGSRNGTFVDGGQQRSAGDSAPPLVRIGQTLLLAIGDVRPYETLGIVVREGVVVGPSLQRCHQLVAQIAESGENLLVNGGSGSGKELSAKAFHAAATPKGPFVAVNCATIQRELSERILFGARRGAYTGATADAVGLVQSADRGTLFLDEIAELDLNVQAKLLRVLETKEIVPLGAVTPVRVDVRLCAATHKSLREEVMAGRFREDLYFRIGRPELRLPPLRERREEIPWLIDEVVRAFGGAGQRLSAGADFVEASMLRPWPGNVREIIAETKAAARAAASDGRALLVAADLHEGAGAPFDRPPDSVAPSSRAPTRMPELAEVNAALREEHGNVARAAARLGIARSRLRRFIERRGIDVKALR